MIPTFEEFVRDTHYTVDYTDSGVCYDAARDAGMRAIAELTARAEKAEAELSTASKAAAQWQDEAGLMTRRLAIAVEALTRLGFADEALREIEECK